MKNKKTDHSIGFSSELNYAHLIDEGVIINKDGAFLLTYKYSGPDVESATSSELDALTENFNRMMTFLEDGWMVHIDELRVPSMDYPQTGYFPDSVSRLIDDERRQLYETKGTHFENIQFLTFVWKLPLPFVKTAKHWFVSGLSKEDNNNNLTSFYQNYIGTIERCTNLLSVHLKLEKLNSADLLSYLNTCITGDLVPVAVPPKGCYLDVALSRKPLIGGFYPKIGNKYIRVISFIDYLNSKTVPGMLAELGTYPLVYRWSNRFIPLSESTAEKEIKQYEKNWSNKAKGLMGIIKDAFTGRESQSKNEDAIDMRQQSLAALKENNSRETRFGYWTSEIVLIHEEVSVLDNATHDIQKYLEQSGFSSYQETVNVQDAWLGTIPGHGSCNMRRLFVTSRNLAQAIPLHTIWAGRSYSAPESLLPKNSPPLFYAATTGKTPFRYHADVQDVGHTLIIGPTGAGKSTLLGLMITQFLRYKNARIKIFDKDFSHQALTEALNGHHYNIGCADQLSFSPLSDLSSETKKMRAAEFMTLLVELQGVKINPVMRSAIHTAIESLSCAHHDSRNITVFRSEVQHEEVREALQYYTINGQLKLLDAVVDSLQKSPIETFETGWLLSQRPEVYLPIFKHIFDQIEASIDESNAQYPTLIILEEAWRYILHSYFKERINDWLLTMRKKNCRIIFTTPTISSLYDPGTKTLNKTSAILMEACPKKIYLPNNHMESETRDIYYKMGLNERQVEIIEKYSEPKRHYYVATPEGERLIELGFEDIRPLALNFIGLSREASTELMECKVEHGDGWVYHWLMKRGFPEWAEYWLKNYKSLGEAA